MPLIFDHAVKYHGKYYPANTPIEEIAPKTAQIAPENAESAEGGTNTSAQQEAARKPVKGRKKGDA